MAVDLPFEQPLAELRGKIEELRKFGADWPFRRKIC
jgi:hypothetical protein